MIDFTRDYPPSAREMHAAEDEADLGPESLLYQRWTLAEVAALGWASGQALDLGTADAHWPTAYVGEEEGE